MMAMTTSSSMSVKPPRLLELRNIPIPLWIRSVLRNERLLAFYHTNPRKAASVLALKQSHCNRQGWRARCMNTCVGGDGALVDLLRAETATYPSWPRPSPGILTRLLTRSRARRARIWPVRWSRSRTCSAPLSTARRLPGGLGRRRRCRRGPGGGDAGGGQGAAAPGAGRASQHGRGGELPAGAIGAVGVVGRRTCASGSGSVAGCNRAGRRCETAAWPGGGCRRVAVRRTGRRARQRPLFFREPLR